MKGCPAITVHKPRLVEKPPDPVGRKAPNPYGLHDMLGNVYEWCQDRWGEYEAAPVNDPCGPQEGSIRVMRGGSWLYHARYVRAASRDADSPGNRYDYLGFRLARGPAPSPVAEPRPRSGQ